LATLYGFGWTVMGGGAAAGSVLMGRAFDASGSYEGMLLRLAAATLAVGLLMLTLPGYRVAIQEQPVPSDLPRSEQSQPAHHP
jgi:hypothetical protein